jgi:hypothetical protein
VVFESLAPDSGGLEALDDGEQELARPRAVDHAMVERAGEPADLARNDLAVHDRRTVADAVKTEDPDLGMVYKRRREEPA